MTIIDDDSHYKLKFTVSGRQKYRKIHDKVDTFEREHPQLNFIHLEHGVKEIKVHDKTPLFEDDGMAYFNLNYNLQHTYTAYYQPSEELHTFLAYLQDNIDKVGKIGEKIREAKEDVSMQPIEKKFFFML